MDRVNIYIYAEKKGFQKESRGAGYILELEREGKPPVTLTDFTMIVDATNNQADIRVVIAALERMTKPSELCIYSMSKYVAAGYTCNWVKEWKKNDWQTKQGKPVSNAEDWKRLDALLAHHIVSWFLTDHHPYADWLEREVKKYAQANKGAAVLTEGA